MLLLLLPLPLLPLQMKPHHMADSSCTEGYVPKHRSTHACTLALLLWHCTRTDYTRGYMHVTCQTLHCSRCVTSLSLQAPATTATDVTAVLEGQGCKMLCVPACCYVQSNQSREACKVCTAASMRWYYMIARWAHALVAQHCMHTYITCKYVGDGEFANRLHSTTHTTLGPGSFAALEQCNCWVWVPGSPEPCTLFRY